LAHIIEIAIYAGAYILSIELFELGNLKGMAENDSMEYLYFSSVIYTSLGIGDIHPTGHIRFLTGIEALNGLLLIAWSAAFAFLAMRRLWPWIECCDTDNKSSRGK
ncbi:MAG: two pore domain potassium channel family protein, partial [Methylococcales bacterium]|nr:two pore domain potassium channel family protein [Methylococcales bacterium]